MRTAREYVRQMNETNQKQPGKGPIKKYSTGAVTATIWNNENTLPNGEKADYQTISLDRNYKDKDGNWKKTNSLRVNDLPKAALVLQKAYEYIVIKEEQ